jgi:putative heme-binding domain-containing protein
MQSERNRLASTSIAAALTLALILSATALSRSVSPIGQEKELKNPFAGDPEAINQGRSLFRGVCAICHGIDARGGRGPDLTLGRWTHGDSDAAIFSTIVKGVPGTEMPPGDFRDEEVWTLVSFLRSLSAGASVPLTGSSEAGEKIFFAEGLCFQCHMVRGKGGRLGPDLSRIGAARSFAFLIESIREPSKEIADEYETVAVVTKDGKRIRGVRKNEDTFSVQLMDEKEAFHLLLKKDLRETISEPKSLMPEYSERTLNEKKLQDVLAYLVALRGK